MKKAYIYILILVLLMISASLWVGMRKVSFMPKIGIAVLQISDTEHEFLEMLIRLDVKNKTPFYFSSDSLIFSVFADGKKLIENEKHARISLKSYGKGEMVIPVKLKVSTLESLAKSKVLGVVDSCNYVFKITLAENSNFFLPDSFSVVHEARLPLFKLPKVEYVSSEVEQIFNKQDRRLNLKLRVTNFNPFDIVLKNPSYHVDIGEKLNALDGAQNTTITIPATSTQYYTVPLHMDLKKIMQKTGKILFKKEEVEVQLVLEAKVQSPHEALEDFKIKTVVKSDMNSLLKN